MDGSKIPKVPPIPAPRSHVPPPATRSAGANLRRIQNLTHTERQDLMSTHTKQTSYSTKKKEVSNSSVSSSVSSLLQKRKPSAVPSEVPPKQNKVERKPAQKIPPYDYKARFNDLLEKHQVLKEEAKNFKDGYETTSEENDNIRGMLQTLSDENSTLKENLSAVSEKLSTVTVEYQQLSFEHEFADKKIKEAVYAKNQIKETLLKTEEELNTTLTEAKQSRLKLMHKTEEFDQLKEKYETEVRKSNRLTTSYDACQTKCIESELQLRSIQNNYADIEKQCKEKDTINATLKKDVECLQNILDSMYKEQKELRNTVQDLRGNIRVFCRIRPPLDSELTKPLFSLRIMDSCSLELEKVSMNSQRRQSPLSFTFDGIFSPHAVQNDVFAEVSPMIQSALDGYNVCIFAYGQTGSGKTYTMEGGSEPDKFGIIPRTFDMIFTYVADLKRMGWDLTIKASFLEIYNETIFDLLEPKKHQDDHEIKMVDSKGTEVFVSNLKEELVKSSYDFTRLMITAQKNRQTAATLCNERSSRSHSVAQVKISAINEKRKEKFHSNLNLVDLAGSESGKTTQRMDETKHINRSLSDLSKVILALQTNQAHVPYRNSKLTYLLMPSLGGNSKTLMMVNVSQFDECFSETVNSLRFAIQVNNCKTAKVKKNITAV